MMGHCNRDSDLVAMNSTIRKVQNNQVTQKKKLGKCHKCGEIGHLEMIYWLTGKNSRNKKMQHVNTLIAEACISENDSKPNCWVIDCAESVKCAFGAFNSTKHTNISLPNTAICPIEGILTGTSRFGSYNILLKDRIVEWAQNEIAVVPDFHKRILFSDEAHFWLNGYVNKQNCRIWSEANPQVYVETPLHPEKLTVRCALWAGGILLQKR
ncbi:hypothetical protein TNCV_1246361 [Trichonephila clavipes]|uniref:Transposase n=1 Tax=Trichonephila clavipes TaxID=2585209 RepID=A0A8X6RGI5_TRICX|nr:hypothetical protein TNCV_1246361 [Trichonephila clavipes]